MRAMVLERVGEPLLAAELPDPEPAPGQLLVRVHACGVCRTDLHVVDGELPRPKLPLVPGHQVVGEIVAGPRAGERVGVPWLGWTCGECRYCREGLENLCDRARFTGYDLDGGYAELAVADERFCFPLPPGPDDAATRAALTVLAALTPQLRQELAEVDASNRNRITLQLADGRVVVWGDADRSATKATVATALLGTDASTIDVSVPEVATTS